MSSVKKNENNDYINIFLVKIFGQILRKEEKALFEYCKKNNTPPISVKEFHLLEAVNLKKKHNKNTAGSIANYLGITIGSLSTAVKTLKKKELIEGVKNTDDKRKLYLFLTKNGEEANEYHQNFHKKMINEIKEELTEEETELMAHTLFKLHKYFGKF